MFLWWSQGTVIACRRRTSVPKQKSPCLGGLTKVRLPEGSCSANIIHQCLSPGTRRPGRCRKEDREASSACGQRRARHTAAAQRLPPRLCSPELGEVGSYQNRGGNAAETPCEKDTQRTGSAWGTVTFGCLQNFRGETSARQLEIKVWSSRGSSAMEKCFGKELQEAAVQEAGGSGSLPSRAGYEPRKAEGGKHKLHSPSPRLGRPPQVGSQIPGRGGADCAYAAQECCAPSLTFLPRDWTPFGIHFFFPPPLIHSARGKECIW